MKKRINKKGISPVVATVLLIAIVVVLGLIIFLWFRGMIQETVIKFGKNAEQTCEDIEFKATYDSNILNIVNSGNVPIYKMMAKIYSGGEHSVKEIFNWPSKGLPISATFSEIQTFGEYDKIELIPILLGLDNEGKKEFECSSLEPYEI